MLYGYDLESPTTQKKLKKKNCGAPYKLHNWSSLFSFWNILIRTSQTLLLCYLEGFGNPLHLFQKLYDCFKKIVAPYKLQIGSSLYLFGIFWSVQVRDICYIAQGVSKTAYNQPNKKNKNCGAPYKHHNWPSFFSFWNILIHTSHTQMLHYL